MNSKTIKKSGAAVAAALASVFLLTAALSGCGGTDAPAPAAQPSPAAVPVSPAEPAEAPGAENQRQDGERFETVITLEGMEETVRYEHVRNEAVGIEMDYDYESFVRRSGPGRERFVSVYDMSEDPVNYLEITTCAEDAESVAAAVRSALSAEYDLLESTRELERAGSCLRIEASEIKGTGTMPDQIRVVYIIPAGDGCRVASAHYAIEAAEGFGRRFSYLLNTLAVINRQGEARMTDLQALCAVRKCCYAADPGLESIVSAGEYPVYWDVASVTDSEIVILFRSYTGAQIRYYIDPFSGETYVTEYVPGITAGEERTEEILNMRVYF